MYKLGGSGPKKSKKNLPREIFFGETLNVFLFFIYLCSAGQRPECKQVISQVGQFASKSDCKYI